MNDKKKLDIEENQDIYASFNHDNNLDVKQEKESNNNSLESNSYVTKSSKMSRAILYGFYFLIVIVGVMVFFMFRSDRYAFYLVKDEVNIGKGATYQVELTPKNVRYFDYLNYKYETDNKNVATVDEFGTVTGVGVGTTTLKISLSPGFTTKTMKINTQGVEVKDIGLFAYKDQKLEKNSKISMNIGDSVTLKAIANNDDSLFVNVKYESSDEKIATVDEFGNVTAKGDGMAVISGTMDSVTGEITINVKSNEESSTTPSTTPSTPSTTPSTPSTTPSTSNKVKVSLGTNQVTKYVGESISLKATVTPSSTKTESIIWSTNNASVATVTQKGEVKAVKKGTAVITVNVDGIKAYCTIIVKEKAATPSTPSQTAPSGTQISAKEITLSKTSITVAKGKTATFTIKVSGALGAISVSSNNSNIATVTASGSDCNGLKCFFDAQTGNESSITYTVKGIASGTTYIDAKLDDMVTYSGSTLTGTGRIGILVQ